MRQIHTTRPTCPTHTTQAHGCAVIARRVVAAACLGGASIVVMAQGRLATPAEPSCAQLSAELQALGGLPQAGAQPPVSAVAGARPPTSGAAVAQPAPPPTAAPPAKAISTTGLVGTTVTAAQAKQPVQAPVNPVIGQLAGSRLDQLGALFLAKGCTPPR